MITADDNKIICPDGIENLDVHMNEFWQRLTACSDIPLDRLTEICNAERNGRLVVLPCKVGDTVYSVYCDSSGTPDDEIEPVKIAYFYVDENGVGISTGPYDGHIGHFKHSGDIDKNYIRRVYFTRAEAEAALKGADHDRD